MPLQKVLVVEDMKSLQGHLKRTLEGKLEIISALTVEDGQRLFDLNPDVAAIVMDACVPGDWPTTIPLVKEIRRKNFTGPMIAISSNSSFRQQLMAAGCSHECDKLETRKKLCEILNIAL